MTHPVLGAVERAYRRPPLSWTVTTLEWLTEQLRRPFRPLLRRSALRRADRLSGISVVLSAAGHHRQAAKIAALACRWRLIAGGLERNGG